ncbi:MAG TPA: NUDIX hydrolase [Candidatus Saccharimonadales bacterium]|nr:NUDIX hydrolase [Candidatus Saccharimonadales bacterium]
MAQVSHDSETPAVGQQVIVACALIHHNFDGVEKVFLAQRAMTKKFYPGVFEIPGGHIDFGEDIVEGLKREIREELGKDIIVGDAFSAFTYMNDIKGAHAIEVTFFAKFVGAIDDIKINPDDHSDWGWFTAWDESKFMVNRNPDDPEPAVVRHGLALLNGKKLDF